MKTNKLRGFFTVIFLLAGLNACNGDGSTGSPAADDKQDPVVTKNIILMITDGASDGTWDIASYWTQGEPLNKTAPYNKLPTRLAMSTFALWQRHSPVSCDKKKVQEDGYVAELAWDTHPANQAPPGDGSAGSSAYFRPFEGYNYLNRNYTDSAAAATAMATGEKTYLGAIGVDYCGQPLTNLVSIAKQKEWATGVVTSVPFNHATPAGFAAHNTLRSNYQQIAHEMLTSGKLDVVMGAGHPHYTNDNQVRNAAAYTYISQADFERLRSGNFVAQNNQKPWLLIEDKNDFEMLAADIASDIANEQPIMGLVQVGSTLQARRACSKSSTVAFTCPFNSNVPTLSTLAKGALNALSRNENGMFVMIEGGAVDWAAHDNNLSALIEEQVDFNQTVATVVEWVERNSNWQETVLIVTSDHGNAFVLGEDSAQIPFAQVTNPGAQNMPSVKFFSNNHTNELVRVYAKGKASSKFEQYLTGTDFNFPENYNHTGASGQFIDNTAIFHLVEGIIMQQQ
ncbi:alkaline phosphatase [Alteromonas ponticola]|nr:alkaline phosphatase [Alteromonas ponticola]